MLSANFQLPFVLKVYLRGILDLLPYEWDYFVNLSGADLPLRPIDDLAAFLEPGRDLGASFLRTHAGDHAGFIRRQGLDQCVLDFGDGQLLFTRL